MDIMYGLWFKGIKPDEWSPDYECCSKEEIERWKRDLEKEKQGSKDFEGFYGIGVYKC